MRHWKLYGEDGAFLPHEDCPMAVAIRENRPIRGAVAAAERPDGTRVMFTPYPTPLIGADGRIAGAVNILIDVTDARQAAALRVQAMRCRRLAQSVCDPQAVETLSLMRPNMTKRRKASPTGSAAALRALRCPTIPCSAPAMSPC